MKVGVFFLPSGLSQHMGETKMLLQLLHIYLDGHNSRYAYTGTSNIIALQTCNQSPHLCARNPPSPLSSTQSDNPTVFLEGN